MIADKDASVTGQARVAIIEQSLLTLLGESNTAPTVAQMTQTLRSIIATQFSSSVADLFSNAIALAIQDNLANSLVDVIADIYSTAIAKMFTTQDISNLLPVFIGPLGDEITAAIQQIPIDAIPSTLRTVIAHSLNSMVAANIAAMVSDDSIDAALADEVMAAEMPAGQLTIGVYSYKGG